MIPFDYHRASSVADAVATVADRPDAVFLAGGTNLVDHMKLGIVEPALVVDVGHLPLADIEQMPDSGLRVGADVRNSDLAAHPGDSIPAACGTWAATKATYRFLDDDDVEAAAIRAAHHDATLARVAGQTTVLVLQDTTALDFSTHPGLTGAGPLARHHGHGVWVHSALVASDEGVPLGLVDQQQWARDAATTGKRHTRLQGISSPFSPKALSFSISGFFESLLT